MTDTLISFTTAKLAKEKGFNDNTQWCYSLLENGCSEGILNHVHMGAPAPTQSLLQKWLRENYNVNTAIMPWNTKKWWWQLEDISLYDNLKGCLIQAESNTNKQYNTYEEALEDALIEALKLIK